MPAFDSQSYLNRYGSALGQLAGADIAESQDQGGSADVEGPDGSAFGSEPVEGQEENTAAVQSSSGNVARMPSQSQMFGRQGALTPPGGIRPEKTAGSMDTGPAQPAEGTPAGAAMTPGDQFHEQFDTKHAANFDQMSDKEVDAVGKQIGDLADKHSNGEHDLESLWRATFNADIQQQSQRRALESEQANKYLNPTWRDKVGMMLDATTRASELHAMYPTAARGDIWAMATRGALNNWQKQAMGMHDASLRASQAFEDHAKAQADAAVKRQMDILGYRAKAQKIIDDQKKAEAESAKNTAESTESPSKIDLNQAKAENLRAAAGAVKSGTKSGNLEIMTDSEGNVSVVNKTTAKAKTVTDEDKEPYHGKKPSTDKADADDNKLVTQARQELDKIMDRSKRSALEQLRYDKLQPPQKAEADRTRLTQAMQQLRITSPKLYRALNGDDEESEPEPQPKSKTKATTTPKAVNMKNVNPGLLED